MNNPGKPLTDIMGLECNPSHTYQSYQPRPTAAPPEPDTGIHTDEETAFAKRAANDSSLAFDLERTFHMKLNLPDDCEKGTPEQSLSCPCDPPEVQLSEIHIFGRSTSTEQRLLEMPHTAKTDDSSQWELKVKMSNNLSEEDFMNDSITWTDLTHLAKVYHTSRKLVVELPGEYLKGPTAFVVIGIPGPGAEKFIKASLYHKPEGRARGKFRVELGEPPDWERNPPSLVLDVAVPVSSTHDQVTIEFFGLNPGITRTNTLVEKVGVAADEAITTNIRQYFLGGYKISNDLEECIQEHEDIGGSPGRGFTIEFQFQFTVDHSMSSVWVGLNLITGGCFKSAIGDATTLSGAQDNDKEEQPIHQIKAFVQVLDTSVLMRKEHRPQLDQLLHRFRQEIEELQNRLIGVGVSEDDGKNDGLDTSGTL